MNKRIISVCLTVVAIAASTNAFASRARQLVMGTADPFGVLSGGSHGTFFYDDNLNFMYNPAYANDHKNWAAIEKSNAPRATAEGGFVTAINQWTLGAYMNRGDVLTNPTTTAYGEIANMRPIEFTFAGDTGAKWGLTYYRAKARNANSAISFEHGVRAGISFMDFEPYMNMILSGQNTTWNAVGSGNGTSSKIEGMGFGVKYHYGEWTPFAAYRSNKATTTTVNVFKTGATGAFSELANQVKTWGLGLGRSTKVGDGVSLNYALGYWKRSNTTRRDDSTTVGAASSDRTIVPIDLSAESAFTSWLTGRAGIHYALMDSTNGNQTTDGTTARLGATFNFGKVNVDWAVGGGGSEVNGAAANNFANYDSQAFDVANGFFTAASITYHW